MGPKLITVLINDVGQHLNSVLFAHETTLISIWRNINSLLTRGEDELEIAKMWFQRNGLALNEDKTKRLIRRLVIMYSQSFIERTF